MRRSGCVQCAGALSLAAVLLIAPSASGTIVNFPGSGWQADVPNGMVVSFVVDSINGELVLQISKDFTDPPGPGGVFPAIPIDFLQVDDDANTVDRIVIADETITNLTGVHWTDYHWALLNMGEAWFNEGLSSTWSVLDQNGNGFLSKTFFDYQAPGEPTQLRAETGPGVPDNTTWFPGTAVGNGELVIDISLGSPNPVSFEFKQFPTPEPSALALMAAGGLLALRRRS